MWTKVLVKYSNHYIANSDIFAFTKKYLKEFDTGIDDVSIVQNNDAKTGVEFLPEFFSSVNGETKKLGYFQQSRGTQELYQYLALYALTLNEGGVLILDEFDVFLHPDTPPSC